jgi:predicted nucleic acid-binding protein
MNTARWNRRASRYPKFRAVLQPAKVGTMVNNLQRAVILEELPLTVEADDSDDAFLLAMALMGNADYLVTGDGRAGLLQRGYIERTRIVTPAVFCAEVL